MRYSHSGTMSAPAVYVYFTVASVVLQCWQLLCVVLASIALNAPLGAGLAWLSSPHSPASWTSRSVLVSAALALLGVVIVLLRWAMYGSR